MTEPVSDTSTAGATGVDGGHGVVLLGWGRHGRRVVELVATLAAGPDGPVLLGYLADHPVADAAAPAWLGPAQAFQPGGAGVGGRVGVVAGADGVLRRWDDLRRAGHLTPAAPLVHPTAFCSRGVQLGAASVVAAYAHLPMGLYTGPGCVIGPAVVLGHEARLGAWCEIGAGAAVSGGVRLGDRVCIGANAVVLEGVAVGDDVVVAPGAVVVADVAPGAHVAGVPARVVADPPDRAVAAPGQR